AKPGAPTAHVEDAGTRRKAEEREEPGMPAGAGAGGQRGCETREWTACGGVYVRHRRIQPMASKCQIHVGPVPVGGGAPVAVQTMTKTETANLAATMEQIRTVADAGADIVRVAVPREQDAEALKTIVAQSP